MKPGDRWYALVLIEDFTPTAVLMFPQDLTQICMALGEAHPDQVTSLQLTRRNAAAICDDPGGFELLGMRIWLPPFLGGRAAGEEDSTGLSRLSRSGAKLDLDSL